VQINATSTMPAAMQLASSESLVEHSQRDAEDTAEPVCASRTNSANTCAAPTTLASLLRGVVLSAIIAVTLRSASPRFES
jgi:hypothetical protein